MKKTSRLFCTVLAIVFILSLSVFAVSAEGLYSTDGTPWDGKTTAASYAFGDGSEKNPYVIASAAQFAFFRDSINSGELSSGKYYILATDINLGGNEWAPIGSNEVLSFEGTFDGCGHTVSDYKIRAKTKNKHSDCCIY